MKVTIRGMFGRPGRTYPRVILVPRGTDLGATPRGHGSWNVVADGRNLGEIRAHSDGKRWIAGRVNGQRATLYSRREARDWVAGRD